ncbi:MFS transporter [Kineococcus arenarius]|uniref:MFS transporter n=1 Tax=Kineococcus sp. SYSU DK007 TaxID=3383128 RepID=UPI003D7E7A3C
MTGPNLLEPGEAVGRALGLPPLTGGFVVSACAQALGAVVLLVGLRPDPLLTATALAGAGPDGPGGSAAAGRPAGGLSVLRSNAAARRAVLTVAGSHATMVPLMSMTPVHLTEHGASLSLVGLTISLHVAGMYALSPGFGTLSDRFGARSVVLAGQVLFLAPLLLALLGSEDATLVTVSLVLLGLGWSASIVAGSTLVSSAATPVQRPRLQGVSDSLMGCAGAAGGALAGPVLARAGFDGLAAVLLVLVLVVALAQREPRRPTRRPRVRCSAPVPGSTMGG